MTDEELKFELDKTKTQLASTQDELAHLHGLYIALKHEREFTVNAHKKTLFWKLLKPFRFMLKMFYLLYKDMKEPK